MERSSDWVSQIGKEDEGATLKIWSIPKHTLRMNGRATPASEPERNQLESEEEDEPSRLEQLPLEVFEEITKYLSYAEISTLRQTSRTMHSMAAGTLKWKALGHFRANYTKLLFAADLFSCQYSALEFCVYELVGKNEGSTCPKCQHKADIRRYLLHHCHLPTERGQHFDHLVKTLRRGEDLPNGSYKIVATPGVSKIINTCERDWFGDQTGDKTKPKLTSATSLPLATAIVVAATKKYLSCI